MRIWNVKSILDWAINYFKEKNIPQSRLSAELLLSSVLDLDRINLYLNYKRVLTKEELATYKEHILKRLQYVPIQYILGEAYFRKIKLYVDSRVLIPRPETELIVEKAFQILKANTGNEKISILEIGTGSGAIAISIAYEIGDELDIPDSSWGIIATENDPEILEIAEKNAESVLDKDKLKNIEFTGCNLVPDKDSSLFKKYKGKIDMVISNPPYISEVDYNSLPSEVRDYEPKSALVAGSTGLEVYKEIIIKIEPYLAKSHCHILFETDPKISTSLKDMAESVLKPKQIRIDKDYNQRDRILIIEL